MKPYSTYLKEVIEEFENEFKNSYGWNPSSEGTKLENEIKSFIRSFADRLLQGFEESVTISEHWTEHRKGITDVPDPSREALSRGWNAARAEMIRRMEEFKKV